MSPSQRIRGKNEGDAFWTRALHPFRLSGMDRGRAVQEKRPNNRINQNKWSIITTSLLAE